MSRDSTGEDEPAVAARLELAAVHGDVITVVPLPGRGSVTLGRGEDCHVRIDNPSVSRRHAVLHLGPPLRIEDLGSANGTFTREPRSSEETARTHRLQRLSKQSIEIAVGERVNLGTTTFVVRRARAELRGGASKGALAAPDLDGPIVRDPAMQRLYDQVARAARSPISVLILGETGVGKEVVARTIHTRSPRAAMPYIEIHCASLPSSLLEGELFGHEKGAFTGAAQARPGLIEAADGGTVFLDEVGELPLSAQVKLLRVLEDRKVLRLGGRASRQLDVRFVAATNRDLEAEIARGNFRQDLYFRLNGVSFTIPPLRERVAEIAPLAEQFLVHACMQLHGSAALSIAPDALACLERHGWPGNVRELRNVIERAVVLCEDAAISPSDLPTHLTGAAPPARRFLESDSGRSLTQQAIAAPPPAPASSAAIDPAKPRSPAEMKAGERQRIIEALDRCAGNQTRAAKLLGISLRTLVSRLGEHDISRPRKS